MKTGIACVVGLLLCGSLARADDLTIIETARPAHDRWRAATNAGLFVYVTAALIDNAETAHCLGQSEAYAEVGRAATCEEANPVLRGVMRRRGVVPALAIKGFANASVAATILALRDHGDTKTSAGMAVGVAVLQAWVAWHNAKALGFSFTVGK